MNTFYLNNSSLPWLACAKQYHLRAVRGLLPPPGGNKYTAGGLAFHKMMQIVGTEACPNITTAVLFNLKNQHEKIRAIPEPLALQYAQLSQQIYDEQPELFPPNCHRREYRFEYTLADDSDYDYCATRTGTIDLLTFSADGYLDITDYKSTAKPIDGALVNSYKLSSQRHFYSLALYHAADLPPKWRAAALNHRIRFRYCFVNAEKNQYYLQQPQLINTAELEVFSILFREKAIYAAAIHADETLALKEGILSGVCWKCPFSSICLADDESNLLTNWPYGSKPYNPNHQDE